MPSAPACKSDLHPLRSGHALDGDPIVQPVAAASAGQGGESPLRPAVPNPNPEIARGRSSGGKRSGRIWLACALLVAGVTGCQTPARLNRIDLAEPGWRVEQGQAIWRLGADRPELAGELTLALHTDGRCFLQFTKTPFALVTAQCSDTRWRIEFPPRRLSFAGSGQPPPRFAWLHLCRALSGRTPSSLWRFDRGGDGGWRLANVRSGETVAGYLVP